MVKIERPSNHSMPRASIIVKFFLIIPLIYLSCFGVSVARDLHVDPSIGDDKNDMVAGKNAQIKTIAVTYGYGKVDQDWGYDYLIEQPSEILELMNGNY